MDITIDFETLALTPTAAPLQLAAQVWKRDDPRHPIDNQTIADLGDKAKFCFEFDVRDCIANGLTIDPSTVTWWSSRTEQQKLGVLQTPTCYPILAVMAGFIDWLNELTTLLDDQQITLWCQGSDFDIPILRNLMHLCNLDENFNKLVPHTQFRDARTIILECGKTILDDFELVTDPSPNRQQQRAIYAAIDSQNTQAGRTPYSAAGAVPSEVTVPSAPRLPVPDASPSGLTHTAAYDCLRTTLCLWLVLHCY